MLSNYSISVKRFNRVKGVAYLFQSAIILLAFTLGYANLQFIMRV